MPPKRPRVEKIPQVFAVKWSVKISIDKWDTSPGFMADDDPEWVRENVIERLERDDAGQLDVIYGSKESALEAVKTRFHSLCLVHWESKWDQDPDNKMMSDSEGSDDTDTSIEWSFKMTDRCWRKKQSEYESSRKTT